MLVFAARRIIQAIPILLGVSLVVFGLVHIVPGNPIDMLMPPEASPEVIAQMKAAFGFDKPLYVQYLLWLGRALRGDFGLSVFNATPGVGPACRRTRQHLRARDPGRDAGLLARHRSAV